MLENDENKAFDAALRWLRNHDAVMVSLPDAEKSIVPEFGLSRFEMAAAHLGFAVKKVGVPGFCTDPCYVVMNALDLPNFREYMQKLADYLHAERFAVNPVEYYPRVAEILRDEILRQGEGEYLHCSALDDLDSYPINASMPEKLPPPRAFRYGSVIGFLGTLGLPAERFSYDKYIEKLKRKAFRNAGSNFICDGFD